MAKSRKLPRNQDNKEIDNREEIIRYRELIQQIQHFSKWSSRNRSKKIRENYKRHNIFKSPKTEKHKSPDIYSTINGIKGQKT